VSRRWTNETANPGSREAHHYRDERLTSARMSPVSSREQYLISLAAGKRVLDVGVVDHFPVESSKDSSNWLHKDVAAAASYILGIDILPEAVASLKAHGYNVRIWDSTVGPIDDTFDVIIVGEVIEHLGNPQGLFRSASKMLSPNGRLVITSPNPHYLATVRTAWRGQFRDNVDHVTYLFPSGIAELAEREGMVLTKYRGVRLPELNGRFRLLKKVARDLLTSTAVSQDAACHSVIYECMLSTDEDSRHRRLAGSQLVDG